MFGGKPIIGICGGIGSGKSFVADLFGELGGMVLRSDDHVRQAYLRDDFKQQLRDWWGEGIFKPTGELDRSAVAKIVFNDATQRQRLESFIHPIVNAEREKLMASAEPAVKAFIWDVPLLFEANLNNRCDCIVFVDAPEELRKQRVTKTRGWPAEELVRRENLQIPLDKKRSLSDYVVSNTQDVGVVRSQVRDVFSRILTRLHSQ